MGACRLRVISKYPKRFPTPAAAERYYFAVEDGTSTSFHEVYVTRGSGELLSISCDVFTQTGDDKVRPPLKETTEAVVACDVFTQTEEPAIVITPFEELCESARAVIMCDAFTQTGDDHGSQMPVVESHY